MHAAIGIIVPVALFCVFIAVSHHFEKKVKNDRALKGHYPASFATRREQMLAEVLARKSAEQVYRESIDDAFNKARESGTLIVTESDYHDIESDMYRSRNPHVKTMLTRFSPVMTKELAELVRDYEIKACAHGFDSEGRAQISLVARTIKWRIEEVPAQYEPTNLKDQDRIKYPDLSAFSLIDEPLFEAARALLGYNDKYIKDESDKLEKEDFYD